MGIPGIDPWNLGIAAGYAGVNMYKRSRRATGPSARAKRYRPSGVYDGKFTGPRDTRRNAVLKSGYAETHIHTGTVTQDGAAYIGIASYPAFKGGSQAQYGRVLEDICIAILRKYFRNYHPGKIEFSTPDQTFDQVLDYSVGTGYGQSYNYEYIHIKFGKPDGTYTQSEGTFPGANENKFLYFSSTTLIPTGETLYTNLRSLGEAIAKQIMHMYVNHGDVPLCIRGARVFYTTTVDGTVPFYNTTYHSTMWMTNCKVSAKVKTVLTVQNQTVADDTTEGFKNTMIDVSCNPIRGKLFYFKDLGPKLKAGFDLGADADGNPSTEDEWFHYWFSKPTDNETVGGLLRNIYIAKDANAANVDPVGCWKTIPERAYFSNCANAYNVTLDPGHIKTVTTRFRFYGTLWNFLKGERLQIDNQNDYEAGGEGEVRSAGFAKGMGTSVILAMEKRLRAGTEGVQLQWQVTTHIATDCSIKGRSYMTKDVVTNAA